MILAPTNNISTLSPSSNSGVLNTAALNSANVSSKDLASTSQLQSVNVSLSSSSGLVAATVAGIPPIYSRPTVAAVNQAQLSPSRPNPSSEGLAENAILSGSKAADRSEDESSDSTVSREQKDGSEPKEDNSSALKLSPEELKMIEELKARDREVKAHEQAHKAVGGQYTGAISYSYQAGPDGKRYAIGGEVPIDVSPIAGDPQATITKMTIVRAAATAPAEPSSQDQAVAAQAAILLAEAQADLVKSRAEEIDKVSPSKQLGSKSDEERSITSENSIAVFVSVSNNGDASNSLVDARA